MNDQWYYGQNGQQKGPFSLDVMKQLASGGQIRREDLVWKDGMPDWVPAGGVADLFPPVAGSAGTADTYTPPTPGAPYPPQNPFPGQAQPLGYEVNQTNPAMQGKATTAMVLGICSIPTCLCPLVGLGLGIAAMIVASKVQNAPNQGHANAGRICGIVGIVLSGLNMIAGVVMRFA